MKKSSVGLFWIIWSLFSSFICFDNSMLHAMAVENERWSFDFENCSVSDALSQITKVTGIDIFINKDRDKRLFSGSYKDQTVDQIVRDLFRIESHAILWSYGDNGLEAISVWVVRGGGSSGGLDPGSFDKYRGPSQRGNVTRKNVGSSKRRARSPGRNDDTRYASLDGKLEKNERQSEKPITTQGSKPSSGLGRSTSGSSEESVTNQGNTQGTTTLWLPMLELNNQGTSMPDAVTKKADGDFATYGAASQPPPAAPEKTRGLEPPPVPPGFSYEK